MIDGDVDRRRKSSYSAGKFVFVAVRDVRNGILGNSGFEKRQILVERKCEYTAK